MASSSAVSTYTRIAVVLTVLTALEFSILYLPAFRPVAIPALVALSLAKFTLVVQFYMHLRYERRVVGMVFLAGILLSLGVWYGTWAIFYYRLPATLP